VIVLQMRGSVPIPLIRQAVTRVLSEIIISLYFSTGKGNMVTEAYLIHVRLSKFDLKIGHHSW
jgi:hypothetical protein